MMTIGDLAQSLVLRSNQTRLKTDIDRLGTELATGLFKDRAAVLKGDTGPLQTLEYTLTQFSAYRVTTTEAGLLAGAMQSALETVQTVADNLGGSLLRAELLIGDATRASLSNEAADALETIVAALNSRAGGRQLFAGVATDRAPLVPAETMLQDLAVHIAGLTETADIEAAIDDWFDLPGGGFETQAYLGGTSDLAAMTLRSGVDVRLTSRADDTAMRDVMKAAAQAALVNHPATAFSPDVETQLLTRAGSRLVQANELVTEERALLGLAQARIDQTAARNEAEALGLEQARLDLVGVDPYETAVRLEQTQVQLESLYSATARAYRVSLLDFIR